MCNVLGQSSKRSAGSRPYIWRALLLPAKETTYIILINKRAYINQFRSYFETYDRKRDRLTVWLTRLLRRARGGKKGKNEEKNDISEGFEGRIWTKFLNCPDPKKLRGGWRGIDFTGN